jgi:hypothetical protein
VTLKNPLIAFIGYARSGKDEAAKPLITAGYNRVCFGDIIKKQIDTLVQRHLGFSAFTEIDAEKKQIRPILEQWGEVNYSNILNHFFETLPNPAVNTRLCRLREAYEWVNRGGIIVRVVRAGNGPETQWSADRVQELIDSGLVTKTIHNYGTVENLHETVRQELL